MDPSGLHWQAAEAIQEIGVPDNLQTMLLARISPSLINAPNRCHNVGKFALG